MCKKCGYFNWLMLTVVCIICVLYLSTFYDTTKKIENDLVQEIIGLEHEIEVLTRENNRLFNLAKANGYD